MRRLRRRSIACLTNVATSCAAHGAMDCTLGLPMEASKEQGRGQSKKHSSNRKAKLGAQHKARRAVPARSAVAAGCRPRRCPCRFVLCHAVYTRAVDAATVSPLLSCAPYAMPQAPSYPRVMGDDDGGVAIVYGRMRYNVTPAGRAPWMRRLRRRLYRARYALRRRYSAQVRAPVGTV